MIFFLYNPLDKRKNEHTSNISILKLLVHKKIQISIPLEIVLFQLNKLRGVFMEEVYQALKFSIPTPNFDIRFDIRSDLISDFFRKFYPGIPKDKWFGQINCKGLKFEIPNK